MPDSPSFQANYDLNALLHIIHDCGGAAFHHDRETEMAMRLHEYLQPMKLNAMFHLALVATLELAKYLEHFELDIGEIIQRRVQILPTIDDKE